MVWPCIGPWNSNAELRSSNRCGTRAAVEAARVTPTLPHLPQELIMATDIKAHITGTIWKIKAAVGDSVDEGDTLIIIESMKMEMPIEAMDPGTVKEVLCQEGQAVAEGQVLMVIED
jgi:acetyl-CoA carboxylase biotin carboxyl carrier protein